MSTIQKITSNQLNNQFQATSPLRGQPITADEEIGVIEAMRGVGFTWDSSRSTFGGCWHCGSSRLYTASNGVVYCRNCGSPQ